MCPDWTFASEKPLATPVAWQKILIVSRDVSHLDDARLIILTSGFDSGASDVIYSSKSYLLWLHVFPTSLWSDINCRNQDDCIAIHEGANVTFQNSVSPTQEILE